MPDFDLFIANRPVASMEGVSVSFTEAELQGIAQRYDPALHEAPIILGHPEHDAPAFGWVKGLAFADGRLQASEHQIDPEFARARSAGRFKKMSARFFTPESPNNPTPGHYYLRDVGFLGAMTPAVKGLRTYSFADDSRVLTFELSFGDLPAHTGFSISRMFGRLRDFLIEKEGAEAAERLIPAWEVESLREVSQRAAEQQPTGLRSFACLGTDGPELEPPFLTTLETPSMTDAEKQALQAAQDKAAALAQENATLKAAQAKAAADDRHSAHVSFADALIQGGRWPSGCKDVLVATLDHLATPPGQGACISFGDGDAARPLHQALGDALQGLPVQVSFGELATKDKASTLSLSDRAIADRARAWKAEQDAHGNHVSFSDAVHHITSTLAAPGAATQE